MSPIYFSFSTFCFLREWWGSMGHPQICPGWFIHPMYHNFPFKENVLYACGSWCVCNWLYSVLFWQRISANHCGANHSYMLHTYVCVVLSIFFLKKQRRGPLVHHPSVRWGVCISLEPCSLPKKLFQALRQPENLHIDSQHFVAWMICVK